MAGLAFRFAMESRNVTAEVFDVSEFEDVARRFAVGPVPMTIINDEIKIVGAVPENQLLVKVLEASAK